MCQRLFSTRTWVGHHFSIFWSIGKGMKLIWVLSYASLTFHTSQSHPSHMKRYVKDIVNNINVLSFGIYFLNSEVQSLLRTSTMIRKWPLQGVLIWHQQWRYKWENYYTQYLWMLIGHDLTILDLWLVLQLLQKFNFLIECQNCIGVFQ